MSRQILTTDQAPRSPLYSQGVKVGSVIYVSGTTGTDVTTGQLAGPTIQEQTRQAMRNCAAILAAGGRDARRCGASDGTARRPGRLRRSQRGVRRHLPDRAAGQGRRQAGRSSPWRAGLDHDDSPPGELTGWTRGAGGPHTWANAASLMCRSPTPCPITLGIITVVGVHPAPHRGPSRTRDNPGCRCLSVPELGWVLDPIQSEVVPGCEVRIRPFVGAENGRVRRVCGIGTRAQFNALELLTLAADGLSVNKSDCSVRLRLAVSQ